MGVIYLRKNLINGMMYVGQTTNLPCRKHNWKTLDKPYSNKVIDSARIEYGLDNFTFEILKECNSKKELDEWERYYIKKLNTRYPNGYNMCDGGKGCIGISHAIPVVQLTLDDKFIKEWESAAEAGRNGYNFSGISACCRGERNSHKKCKWMYKSDYEHMQELNLVLN